MLLLFVIMFCFVCFVFGKDHFINLPREVHTVSLPGMASGTVTHLFWPTNRLVMEMCESHSKACNKMLMFLHRSVLYMVEF